MRPEGVADGHLVDIPDLGSRAMVGRLHKTHPGPLVVPG